MTLEPLVAQFLLTLLGGTILAGIGFILRSLSRQNDALAVLVERVGKMNHVVIEKRLLDLEADMVRVWHLREEDTKKLLEAK